MDRRAVLSGAATLIASGLAQPAYGRENTRVYTSGDTIKTAAGRVRINGWKLELDKADFETHSKRHPKCSVAYKLLTPGDNTMPTIRYDPSGLFITSSAEADAEKLWMFGFPSTLSECNYLDYEERRGDITLSHTVYPVKFKYYGYKPDPNDSVDIFSEVPLKESDFVGIHRIAKDFEYFLVYTVPVYVCHHGDAGPDKKFAYPVNRWGISDPIKNTVSMSSDLFHNPIVTDDGNMTTFHEFSHCVVDRIRRSSDQKKHRSLSLAYEDVLAASGGVPESGPNFNVFCESEYFPELSPGSKGHPWDNYDELFASATTVFRFFPGEFIQRLESSNEHVKNAARTCLNVVEEIDADGKHREQLLPAYRQLAAVLK